MKFAQRFLTLTILLSAMFALPVQAKRECLKLSCVDIYYYEDASLKKVVGVRSNCPGRKGLRGRVTQWKEREQEPYEICQSQPTKLPCEFSGVGCGNLPR
jgi:hypothetical protein